MKKIIVIALVLCALGCNETNNNNSTNNNTNNQEVCNDNIDNDFDGLIDCNDSDCRFNGACTATDCGNGLIDPGELCDGTDLDGASCESLRSGTGTLTCDNYCAYDMRGCHKDPLKIYQSGERIQMRVGRAPVPDGSIDFKGWFDTALRINCVFRKHTDGSYRCLPELTASTERWYIDAACTVRLAVFPLDDDPIASGTSITMEAKTGKFGVFVVSGTVSGQLYKKAGTGCWGDSSGVVDAYTVSEGSSSVYQEHLESIE